MHFHWNLVKMHLPHVLFLIFLLIFVLLYLYANHTRLTLFGAFPLFFLFIEIEAHCAFQADFAELELQVSYHLV